MKAHRKRLAHSEMMQAQTTAALINFSFHPPEKPAQPADFCFNLQPPKTAATPPQKLTESEVIDWQTRVANLAAEMRREQGR